MDYNKQKHVEQYFHTKDYNFNRDAKFTIIEILDIMRIIEAH